jgi:hypothetical protein
LLRCTMRSILISFPFYINYDLLTFFLMVYFPANAKDRSMPNVDLMSPGSANNNVGELFIIMRPADSEKHLVLSWSTVRSHLHTRKHTANKPCELLNDERVRPRPKLLGRWGIRRIKSEIREVQEIIVRRPARSK